MSFAPCRLAIAVCAFTTPMAFAAALPASAAAPGTYLTWQNKAPQAASAPAVVSGGAAYPVPPSPYGQVGDPFVKARGGRALSWPSKQEPPRAEAQYLANIDVPPPPAAELPKGPVSLSSPVPVAKPAPVHVPDEAVAAPEAPPALPKPAPQAMRPIPNPAPAAPKAATAKTAAAKPAPAPQPASGHAASQPTASDGGYQVPATSKYAARIAQARASEARDVAPPPAAKSADKPTGGHTASAPAPAEPLAAQETDHVFIPGEQYKNPEDGPRLYSLHRAYGLAPDPITVDRDATGAILESADLNADEGPKKPDSQDSHSSDKPDTKANQ